jgi:hypothetical protein
LWFRYLREFKMWQIPELIPHLGKPPATASKRIFFAIYYKSSDDAFKYAALCWLSQVKLRHSANGEDITIEREVSSESEFVTAWEAVGLTAKSRSAEVYAGNLLTHASKQTARGDGLEFKGGTLEHLEIVALAKLPWSSNGFLILSGCNTGLINDRRWAPAHSFALGQGVPTVGQDGYAYFSNRWSSYNEKSAADSQICLWAYARGQNGFLGGGGRVSGIVYKP